MARLNRILAYIWLIGAITMLTLYWLQPTSVSDGQPTITSQTDPIREITDTVKANAGLRTNRAAVGLIMQREGLELETYEGFGGQLHIGYGHSANVRPGMAITVTEAESLLRDDLVIIEQEIQKRLQVPVNENEFSAMVLLAYNIGTGAFGGSSVLTELNNGDRAAAANAFLLWNKIQRGGVLEENSNLTKHREEERELFLS